MELKKISAIDALDQAHRIAFSPIVFQSVNACLKLGILEEIFKSRTGISDKDLSEKTGVSEYGIAVLLDLLVMANVVDREKKFNVITKVGYFLMKDEMTKVNFNFMHDVCYNGAFYLKESIENGKPEGLKVFGEWDTLYEGMKDLPEDIRKSWFDFDHYYSDGSFDEALEIIFKNNPKKILDIGGNTGKWSLRCVDHNDEVEMTMVDLPGQIATATQNINGKNGFERIGFYEQDMLKEDAVLPKGADVVWMSQFLDCFSKEEITHILTCVKDAIDEGTEVYIMETFVDKQSFPAAEFSLHCTSLYFTFIANGNSRMYPYEDFKECVEKAGLKVDHLYDKIGGHHSIMKCSKA